MKILTVGGAMIDTIAIIDSDRIERRTMLNADSSFLLLEEGRKTEAEDPPVQCGFDRGGIESTPWLILSIAARAASAAALHDPIVRRERPSSSVRPEPESLKRIPLKRSGDGGPQPQRRPGGTSGSV